MQTVTTVEKTANSDTLTAGRLLGLLIAAVLGFLIRAVWDAYQARRTAKKRDIAVLWAVLTEIRHAVRLLSTLMGDLAREKALLQEDPPLWLRGPTVRIPTAIYELVRSDPPKLLVEDRRTLADLIISTSMAAHLNSQLDAQQQLKGPGAWTGQVEGIGSFRDTIESQADELKERLKRVEEAVRDELADLGEKDVKS